MAISNQGLAKASEGEFTLTPESVLKRYARALARRSGWESHWNECLDFSLPQRAGAGVSGSGAAAGGRRHDRLFDGTAADAVDQLAASLLAHLTPPWSNWVGLEPGSDVSGELSDLVSSELEASSTKLQSNFDRSNFSVEIHQCFLDLITVGTATLMFEEAPLGDGSAFRFTAVPVFDVVFEESANGRLDGTFRRSRLSHGEFKTRFPDALLPKNAGATNSINDGEEKFINVIEAVLPEGFGYAYMAVMEPPLGGGAGSQTGVELARGWFENSPFINFRWLKAPGETYGRSPVMKALPDIKTANKVVELILKNASIAVTGIWQADDDGVLNPATIKLTPGTIIPKAVGSAGLTPLEAPGRFDVSELVLGDLRTRIRQALLADQLGQINGPKMSATEVLERSGEMARILGATYGRMQSELLTPLIERGVAILRRRGALAEINIDGDIIDIDYRSPLARSHALIEAKNTLHWVSAISALGPDALAVVDTASLARWLASAFGVPSNLVLQGPSDEESSNPTMLEDAINADALAVDVAALMEGVVEDGS